MQIDKQRIYEFFLPKEAWLFSKIVLVADERMLTWEKSTAKICFLKWIKFVKSTIKAEKDHALTGQAVEILKSSIRCHRTTLEKDTLQKFIFSALSCVPRDKLTLADVDKLCNEVDWIPLVGKSILFLQGDFGNVYYMIAKGKVELYLEASKDREMDIAREFEPHRGHIFSEDQAKLDKLGKLILTLPAGAGFGEFAILNASKKMRSCAAVAASHDSLLLILHADTYNSVMRKLHTRQRQLTLATSLMGELPMFNHFNHSKLSAISYTLKCTSFSPKTVIVKAGDTLDKIYLIISGSVLVMCPQSKLLDVLPGHGHGHGHHTAGHALIERRMPNLSFAQFGRGQIIGETEVHLKQPTFQMTYVVNSADCEVFEMDLSVYQEVICQTIQRNEGLFRSIEKICLQRESKHQQRIVRTCSAMRTMMSKELDIADAKAVLLCALPVITEGESDSIFMPTIPSCALNLSQQSQSTNRESSALLITKCDVMEHAVVQAGRADTNQCSNIVQTSVASMNPNPSFNHYSTCAGASSPRRAVAASLQDLCSSTLSCMWSKDSPVGKAAAAQRASAALDAELMNTNTLDDGINIKAAPQSVGGALSPRLINTMVLPDASALMSPRKLSFSRAQPEHSAVESASSRTLTVSLTVSLPSPKAAAAAIRTKEELVATTLSSTSTRLSFVSPLRRGMSLRDSTAGDTSCDRDDDCTQQQQVQGPETTHSNAVNFSAFIREAPVGTGNSKITKPAALTCRPQPPRASQPSSTIRKKTNVFPKSVVDVVSYHHINAQGKSIAPPVADKKLSSLSIFLADAN